MRWYYYCYYIIVGTLAVVCSACIQHYHRCFVGKHTHIHTHIKQRSFFPCYRYWILDNSGPDATSFSLSIYLILGPALHSFVVILLPFIFQAIRSPYL